MILVIIPILIIKWDCIYANYSKSEARAGKITYSFRGALAVVHQLPLSQSFIVWCSSPVHRRCAVQLNDNGPELVDCRPLVGRAYRWCTGAREVNADSLCRPMMLIDVVCSRLVAVKTTAPRLRDLSLLLRAGHNCGLCRPNDVVRRRHDYEVHSYLHDHHTVTGHWIQISDAGLATTGHLAGINAGSRMSRSPCCGFLSGCKIDVFTV